jgi:hypothetical protein
MSAINDYYDSIDTQTPSFQNGLNAPPYPTAYVPKREIPRVVKVTEEERMTPTTADVPEVKYHSHYFKDVSHLDSIDVYRVLDLFGVVHPCIQHAVKKLLVAGGRGAGKTVDRDVQEAIDSLTRYQKMMSEDYP